jgi:hypothetical protein
LSIWWKQLNSKSNQIHFKNEYLGKPSWACLSHRSLEGGTRVQQIIIGYFVAPISGIINSVEAICLITNFQWTLSINDIWIWRLSSSTRIQAYFAF